jgi:formylglycine-generating enzyme required for sulfatase activity
VYALPTPCEWHKVACYSPALNGGAGGYYRYAVASDTAPTPVASGVDPNTTVYGFNGSGIGPADITQAGGLSSYGVMCMNGNVWELNESPVVAADFSPGANRVVTGGSWSTSRATRELSSETFQPSAPGATFSLVGFRVVSLQLTNGDGGGSLTGQQSVPEPGLLLASGAITLLGLARSRVQQITKRALYKEDGPFVADQQ